MLGVPDCALRACAQVSSKDFFIKTLPLFDGGDDVGMVLSPQCFHNLNLHTDIFNHSNVHFWRALPLLAAAFLRPKHSACRTRSHAVPHMQLGDMCCNAACREYMQPGYDAMGFISCTGTNFLVRPPPLPCCVEQG